LQADIIQSIILKFSDLIVHFILDIKAFFKKLLPGKRYISY